MNGVSEALKAGHFVINVAEEIVNGAQAKIVIEPYCGEVRSQLDVLARLINEVLLNPESKVVVHCAMGMERSVLAVVWYLHSHLSETLDSAYKLVKAARPIALDRRDWINS